MAASGPVTGQMLGHYRIVERIGAGGMGVVYRAHDERLDRDVALKVLPPGRLSDEAARSRFRKEALALSKLNHPNIATVYDFDTAEGIEFLVMEFVPGITLDKRLARKPLAEKEVVAFGEQITEALEEAHEKGIIHRDLKPGNVMVTPKGQIKLLDFGLARLLPSPGGDEPTQTLTKVEGAVGTLPYMAPEQLRGEEADTRSDIYAAGAVLYEMATGRRAFSQVHGPLLIDAILHEVPTAPSGITRVSPGLENIIFKALDKNPAHRYQSVRELLIDLQRLLSPSTVTLPPRSRTITPSAVLVAVLGLLFVIGAVLGLQHWSRRPAALSPRDWVLVADFENRTGEAVFDRTLRELLVTELEQSQYVNVFPSARVSDVLRRMKRSDLLSIDEATGREICLREGLQALVIGSVSRIGGNYVVVMRAIRPSGDTLLSAQKVATSVEQVPHALDALAKSLRTTLGESRASVEQTSLPLAQVTSSSLDAVQYFSTAKQLIYAGNPQQAIIFLQKALEFDSEFAMAHEYLGIAYQHVGDPVRAKESLRKATLLVRYVPEREKRKILGDYYLLIRDYDRAIGELQVLTQLHPQDAAAHLNLGQCYLGKFDFERALAETNEAVRLDPQPIPLTNVADIYLLKGEVDRGMAIAEEILRTTPAQQRALYDLGRGYVAKHQMDDARQVFEKISNADGEMQSDAHAALADLAVSSGCFRQATPHLQAAVALDSSRGSLYGAAFKKLQLAATYLQQGSKQQCANTVQEIDQSMADPQLLLLMGILYAQAHHIAHAEKMLLLLERQADQDQVPVLHSFMQLLRTHIAMARGDTKAAIEAAEAAVRYENSTMALETLGHVYRIAGRYWDAIREFESVLSRRNERLESYDRPAFHHEVELHYYLGVLYDQVGQTDRAHQHLKEFLGYWNSPDIPLKIYIDARRRLGATKGVRMPLRGKPTPAT